MSTNPTLTEDQKHQLKNRILTDLYQSEELKKRIDFICFKNKVHRDTGIFDDVYQETFVHLARKTPDYIIEIYCRNPRELHHLAISIAIRKGVSKDNRKPVDYPNHSLLTQLFHFSNLNKSCGYKSGGGEEESEQVDEINLDSLPEEPADDAEEKLWDLIRTNLDEENLQNLEYFLTLDKKAGRFKKDIKAKHTKLLEAIKKIIYEHAINVVTPLHKTYKKESFKTQYIKSQYMMNLDTLFKNIETLLPLLHTLQEQGTVKISADQYNGLRDAYLQILPGAQLNLACESCVRHYLSVLESYYSREYPKFQRRLLNQQTLEEPINNPPEPSEESTTTTTNKNTTRRKKK